MPWRVDGSYTQPTAVFEFQGAPRQGISWDWRWAGPAPNYWVVSGNSAAGRSQRLAATSTPRPAPASLGQRDGSQITLTYMARLGRTGTGGRIWVGLQPTTARGALSPSWAMFQGEHRPAAGAWTPRFQQSEG